MLLKKTDEDYVPKDNNDFVKHYSTFVSNAIRKANKVADNSADIIQHVWLKLFEADFLRKYDNSYSVRLPEVVTASSAAAYLKMQESAFKMAVYRYVLGVFPKGLKVERPSKVLLEAVESRDHGVCASCGTNMNSYASDLRLMPKDLQEEERETLQQEFGIPKTRQVFWVVSRFQNFFLYRTRSDTGVSNSEPNLSEVHTLCLFCCPRVKGQWAPSPISGDCMSSEATYSKVEIERYAGIREEFRIKGRKIVDYDTSQSPHLPKTRGTFKQYLYRAVYNIYVNWLRTKSRRHKEIVVTPREGSEEVSWESAIVDPHGCQQEVIVDLTQTVKLLASGKSSRKALGWSAEGNQEREAEILKLLSEGYNLNEIASTIGLSVKGTQRMVSRGM